MAAFPVALLEQLQQQIKIYAEGLERGEVSDVEDVEATAQQLLEALQRIPAENAAEYAQYFSLLSQELTSFYELLKIKRAEIHHTLSQLNIQQKAQELYRSSAQMQKKTP